MTTTYIGPFETDYVYKIAVDGFEVPKVLGAKLPDGKWRFLLDGRFSWDADESEVQQWMWILANAMAIGAGYTHFGENSQKSNIYSRRIVGITLSDGHEVEIYDESN